MHHSRSAGARTDPVAEALRCLDTAAVLTDEVGRPFFLNRAAEDLLALRDGLRLEKGTLRCASAEDQHRLSDAVSTAVRAKAGSPAGGRTNLQVSRPSGRMAFQIAVTPARGCAALLVGNPEQEPGAGMETLRELFDLTPREAAVARCICRGDSLPEIAAALGVSHNTVRTHLSRILNKTGARRQSEIVKLLLSIPTARDDSRANRDD